MNETYSHGTVFNPKNALVWFSDANQASYRGCITFISGHACADLSTNESVYIAASKAARELAWQKQLEILFQSHSVQ